MRREKLLPARISCNSSAFGFLLQASSHAKSLRDGLMHLSRYVFLRTLQQVQSPGLNCYYFISYFKGILAAIFFFAVFAAVDFFCLICQYKYVRQLLLDGCDAAWIFAFENVPYLFWEGLRKLLYNLTVLDDVDRDVVVLSLIHI